MGRACGQPIDLQRNGHSWQSFNSATEIRNPHHSSQVLRAVSDHIPRTWDCGKYGKMVSRRHQPRICKKRPNGIELRAGTGPARPQLFLMPLRVLALVADTGTLRFDPTIETTLAGKSQSLIVRRLCTSRCREWQGLVVPARQDRHTRRRKP